MKKLFPFILIALIAVQLLAPFTIGSGGKNDSVVRINKAEAATEYFSFEIRDKSEALVDTKRYESMVDCTNGWTSTFPVVGSRKTDCAPYVLPNPVNLQETSGLPPCGLLGAPGTVMGCIAQGLYYVFFKTTSFIFGLTGKVLDFTFMYSLKDTSYRSTFVVEGWGIVRDFVNMFFIFVLLYIAIGTILNLSGVKTKEMIINVVIIGLLINFSLFATQVIIDASNILARVFYNPQTIVTGVPQKDANGNAILDANGKQVITTQPGKFGEIQLSMAIVSKVDPQKLVLEASRVGNIPTTLADEDKEVSSQGISIGTFILIVFLATAFNIIGMIAFLSCAIIFISRVIGLWLAMILAPIAFFSYTVPALAKMKMVGWENWWKDLLSMAFLAPVFAFFMYIIVGFMDKGLGMIDTINKTGLDFVIALIVPFVFIMVLLMKAKSVASDMSGELGKSITSGITKAGGMALGVAGGVALGGLAMASRATVGRLGNKLATSEWASTHGAIGRGLGNVGKWAGSGSMDIRGVKIAGKGLSDTGVKFGKAKEGGYAKHLSEKVEKRQKRAKELEVHENEPLKQALNKTENDLQGLLVTNAKEIDSVDKLIEKKRQEADDASRKYNAVKDTKGPGETVQQTAARTAAQATLQNANSNLDSIKQAKTDLREGRAYSHTDIGAATPSISGVAVGTATHNIDSLEKQQKVDAQAIKTENATRKNEYARGKAKRGGRANKKAEHEIIMETKLDSGTKT